MPPYCGIARSLIRITHEESNDATSHPRQPPSDEKHIAPHDDGVDYLFWGFCVNLTLVIATLIIAIFAVVQAMAAKQSADSAVSTDRAWLIATMQQDLLSSFVQADSFTLNVFNVVCTIKNYGKTPAWVAALGMKMHLLESGESLPDEPNYLGINGNQGQPMWEAVLPPDGFVQQFVTLLPSQIGDIRTKKLTLYIYGYARYRDAFNRRRETKFCFQYHVPIGLDLRPEGFYEGGPPAYIGQT